METSESLFVSLVYSIHMTAVQQLGAVANPMTGKKELDIPQAKVSLDMLDMLAAKTEGHLTDYEGDFLSQSLTQLHELYNQLAP